MSKKKEKAKLERALEQSQPEKLVPWYAKKYKVSLQVAREKLSNLGYDDEVMIESFEEDGIKWKYMLDGYSGTMKVVPEETEEWELFQY